MPVETVRSRRALWVAALRDAESYPQTRGCVHDGDGFCCLGVAEDVRDRPWVRRPSGLYHVTRPRVSPRDLLRFKGIVEDQSGTLSGETAWWYGFVVSNPLVAWRPLNVDVYLVTSLADLNDVKRLTLAQIADVIEDQSPDWNGGGDSVHADVDRRNAAVRATRREVSPW